VHDFFSPSGRVVKIIVLNIKYIIDIIFINLLPILPLGFLKRVDETFRRRKLIRCLIIRIKVIKTIIDILFIILQL
jgi:hypothetical protein